MGIAKEAAPRLTRLRKTVRRTRYDALAPAQFWQFFVNFGSPYRARALQSRLIIRLLGESGRPQGSGPTGEYPHSNTVFTQVHNTL
jgi:hypothetical protein